MTGTSMRKVTGLWRRTSAKCSDYFSGRLAGVKIVILENRERQTESDPTHFLFFAEPTSPTAGSAQRQDVARRLPRTSKRPRFPTPKSSGPIYALPDDPLDDLYRRGEP
jgi:hypothetical protein